MDRFQRSWFRLIAKNHYLELKRQEFQAWVGKLFELGFLADYIAIRLTKGDGGLDGVIVSEDAVVAVYAPRDATKSVLEKKVSSDFTKAKKTLKDRNATMRKFVFVHNDEGLTKDVGTFMLTLRADNPRVAIEIWTFERLWKLMEDTLSSDQFQDLLGEAPTTQVMDRLEMPSIRDVIDHLTSVKVEPSPLDAITIPDPEKLKHNQLNDYNQHVLRGGRSKHGKVEQYFSGMTDPNAGEEIAEGFRRKYAACRESGMLPDETFETLWNLAGGNHFTKPPQQAGVTAVMSHFFDTCDIFENVPEST